MLTRKILNAVAQVALTGGLALAACAPASAATATVTRVLVNGYAGNSDWALYSDNTKLWIDSGCKATLQSAGVTVSQTDWNEVGRHPVGGWQSCNAMLAGLQTVSQIDEPRPVGVNFKMLINRPEAGAGNAGWIIHSNNTRQWIDGACRTRLQSAGLNGEVTFWDDIGQYGTGTWRSCDSLETQIRNAGPQIVQPTTPTTTPPAAPGSQCIGINDGFSYSWDGGQLATDAMKNASPPVLSDFRTPAPTDGNMWPVGYQEVNIPIGEGAHDLAKLNPWVLLPYEQAGAWNWGPSDFAWELEGANYRGGWNGYGVKGHEFNLGGNTITLKIRPGNVPTSPRNKWHLVPKSVAGEYAKAMAAENYRYIFDTDKYGLDKNFPLVHANVKQQMNKFCRLRYMIGNQTNTLQFSGYAANRTKPSHPTFNTKGGDGIPFEWKVWIANHLNVGVWQTDHVKTFEGLKAGDSYLSQQANYFRDHLEGTVIREYGNEIWNTSWPFNQQTDWVWQNWPYADGDRSSVAELHWSYGYRTYDTAEPWERAYASRRQDLDLTVGIQTDNPFHATNRLIGPQQQPWYTRADSVSGTFYFGTGVGGGTSLFNQILRTGHTAVVADHWTTLSRWKEHIRELMARTEGLVDKYHLYEGGTHMIVYDFNQSNANHRLVASHIRNYLNSSDYTFHLNHLFNWWRQQPGAGEAMWFMLTGTNDPASPWGYFSSATSTQGLWGGERGFFDTYWP